MTVVIPTSFPRYPSRRGSTGLCAALLTLCVAPFPAQGVGPETHVEFNLSHTERVGGVNSVLTDTNLPGGIDGTNSVIDTGSINGTYGEHEVTVSATVDSVGGLTRLRARGEHSYELSGLNQTTDQWRLVTGTQTLRATHVDELSFLGGVGPLTVEMYWDVRGSDDALIDLLPSQSVVYSFDTDVSLTATTVAPNSGGGAFNQTLPYPGGLLSSDLSQSREADPGEEYVVMTFEVDSGEDLEVETTFEVSPFTHLNNSFEGFVLSTSVDGHHDARFDQSAVLVGVIVRDSGGNILPGILIFGDSGNTYPVLDEVPVRPLPPRVILSPVAVEGTDLGELGASTPLGNMINQSGLVKSFNSGVTSFDTYFDLNPVPFSSANFTNVWQSLVDFSLPLTGHVDFDLGGTLLIDRVAIWNTSLQNIRVQLSDSPGGPWQEVGQYALPNHWPFLSYRADMLDLGGVHAADYLRIQIDSAHKFSFSDTFTYAVVGEVAVSAIPVPEPDAWGMLAAGVPAVALLGRLRARRVRERARD